MSLLMTIIEYPENCTVQESSKTFGEQGGTIGRGAENYWILSDPDCYLSSCHSQISFENGVYLLTDISTNGTFLNGSREPMGKGNKVQLQDGDEIELSDYKFKINLWASEQSSVSPSFDNTMSADDPFAAPDLAPHSNQSFDYTDPFATGEIVSPVESLVNSSSQETDPLAVLDNQRRITDNASFNSDAFANNSYADQADVMSQAVAWPTSNPKTDFSGIPEDWDVANDMGNDDGVAVMNNDVAQIVTNTISQLQQDGSVNNEAALNYNREETQELQNENIKLREELNVIRKKFIAYQKKNQLPSNMSVDTTTIRAMGLPVKGLTKKQVHGINQMVGEMIRETVSGMMQVLTSRNSIKNEFRMNVTTIQPVENNPLKFSANVDDALENMFVKKGSSYKKPIEAIQDGFHGIAEHQVAILAGIHAAFKGAIERFNPESLEDRFDRQSKGNLDLIPGLKKARNWNQFIHYYKDLFDDMDDSFQYLFGDEFVRAYEDQLQRLVIERKSNLHKG
ncbi:Uncharacterized protein ImpI/VasC [hydrothermal vent metagenome]|uniref:Uncharacterized protein ImpI/VasC n=1 Tax=hydrothermal vent metagenome TaxID=652676 RepID=A0A3B1AEI0_9ZZZZ